MAIVSNNLNGLHDLRTIVSQTNLRCSLYKLVNIYCKIRYFSLFCLNFYSLIILAFMLEYITLFYIKPNIFYSPTLFSLETKSGFKSMIALDAYWWFKL